MIEEKLTPLICPRFLHEEKYRQGHIRIINALPGRRILGLHLPEMKQIAKELARQTDVLDVLHAFEKEYQADRFNLSYEERRDMGRNARKKIEREFDRRIVVDAYMEEITCVVS